MKSDYSNAQIIYQLLKTLTATELHALEGMCYDLRYDMLQREREKISVYKPDELLEEMLGDEHHVS